MRDVTVRLPAPTLAVAAVFLVTVELLRAASPLLDLASADLGVVGAARLAVLIFVAPALVGLLVAVAGIGRAAVGLVLGLVLLRLAAQAQDPPTLLVVGAGAAVGVAALVLVVRLAPTGVAATTGVLLGTAADLAVRAGAGTWDPIFRPGALPWLLAGTTGAVAVLALLVTRRRPTPAEPGAEEAGAGEPGAGGSAAVEPGAGRSGVVGAYLALYVLGYGSAPILASHAGLPLPAATVVLVGAAVVGIELVRRLRLPGGSGAIPEPDRWFAGFVALLGVAGGIAAGYWLTGPLALAGLLLAALSAAVLLARALTAGRAAASRRRRPGVGYAWAGLAAGLGYVLPVMIYQVHYDLELPFDNRLALVGIAVVLGLAGLGTRPGARAADRRGLFAAPAPVSVLAVLALLVPLAIVVTRPPVPEPDQAGDTVRLMSWNLMYGRDPVRGDIDLEAIADVVEQVDPDVLALQEVGRGWPIGGGVDMLSWLARRLRMDYEWAPAANGQFGNAVLTRMAYSDPEVGRLPYGQGPMERSYLATTLRLAGGGELHLIDTHLQHRTENTPTRLAQTETLLEFWDGAPRTVIAGDFNFWPSWPEAGVWEAAGFVSAQDVTGHGAEFTVPSYDPDNRVDWIFGTPDLAFSDFAILDQVTASDHFPLVVTVQVA
jgi:endonuclease/exonuclease/phosphatase family metal-dependent hydrolase